MSMSLRADAGGLFGALQVGGVDSSGDLRPLVVGTDGAMFAGGNLVRVSAELTRPGDTTPYSAGDVVSNSTSATTLLTLTNALRPINSSHSTPNWRAWMTTNKWRWALMNASAQMGATFCVRFQAVN